jgi:uncharacterized protein (TIGR00266 family)
MEYQIRGNPDQANVTLALNPGDSMLVESGSMSFMSSDMEVKAQMVGGWGPALARKLLGGQSLFLSEYRASKPGFVSLAPMYPGSIVCRELNGSQLLLTAGSFLACDPRVQISTRFGGWKAMFSGEGAFVLQCQGTGPLFFTAYGGVVEREVSGEFKVDTGHVVAWEPTLDYTISGMGGVKQTLFSGEGLIMSFTGTGRIYLQTRHIGGLVRWLSPFCR